MRKQQTCLPHTLCLTYPLLSYIQEKKLLQPHRFTLVMLFACSGAYPPHAMATVRPRIANDDQKDGNVSTLSGVAAEVVCATPLSSSASIRTCHTCKHGLDSKAQH